MRPFSIVASLLALSVGIALIQRAFRRDEIDVKDFDRTVKSWAEETAPVDRVSCSEASRKKGTTFQCQASLTGGKSYLIDAEVVDDDGLVRFHWRTPIVSAERLSQMIASGEGTAQNKDVTIDCGKGILEVPPVGLLCFASTGDAHGHLRVKLDAKTKAIVWSPEP